MPAVLFHLLTSIRVNLRQRNLKRLINKKKIINMIAYNKVDVLRDNHGIQAVNTLANSIFKVAGKTSRIITVPRKQN